MTLIFAHRGSAGTHPENTMSAFKEAARVGADGIETDVQLEKMEKWSPSMMKSSIGPRMPRGM